MRTGRGWLDGCTGLFLSCLKEVEVRYLMLENPLASLARQIQVSSTYQLYVQSQLRAQPQPLAPHPQIKTVLTLPCRLHQHPWQASNLLGWTSRVDLAREPVLLYQVGCSDVYFSNIIAFPFLLRLLFLLFITVVLWYARHVDAWD